MTLAATAAGGVAAQTEGPTVTVYRSWVEPDFTVVEGLVGIDPTVLDDPNCEYNLAISVRDTRSEIFQDAWEGQCPRAGGQYAPALETFRFALPAGADYSIEVVVAPRQQSARRLVRTVEVEAYGARPTASDLVLAHGVGLDSVAGATLKRGQIGIRAASSMVVMTEEPQLSYYVEVYPAESVPLEGRVLGVVLRADGRQLVSVPLQQLSAVSEAQPVAGTLSVAGLPAGSYRFDVRLELADTVVVRSHPFLVFDAASMASSGTADFYRNLTEADLEQFDAVRAWLTKTEADLYVSLSPAGKREFLARQFAHEAPTPDDGQESAIDAFVQRSRLVHDRYSEKVGRGSQPGWLTDRGRTYMLHGEPANLISRPSPINGAPYEIWAYAAQQRYVYLFADETRMQNYRLIYSNDPKEQGVADWTRRVGPEAVRDMWSLGIRAGDGTGDLR